MKKKRDNVDDKLENMVRKPEGTEEKAAGMDEGSEGTEEKAANMDEGSEGTEEKAASVDESSEGTEEKTASAEEKPESTGEAAAADKTDHKSKDEKKRRGRRKITGIVELAVAFLMVALSAWLFINTRGTRLLYVSVTTGRISRYYWVFFAIAAMCAVLGLTTLKSCHREGRKNLPKKDKKTP